jgi:hypothetical protein
MSIMVIRQKKADVGHKVWERDLGYPQEVSG